MKKRNIIILFLIALLVVALSCTAISFGFFQLTKLRHVATVKDGQNTVSRSTVTTLSQAKHPEITSQDFVDSQTSEIVNTLENVMKPTKTQTYTVGAAKFMVGSWLQADYQHEGIVAVWLSKSSYDRDLIYAGTFHECDYAIVTSTDSGLVVEEMHSPCEAGADYYARIFNDSGKLAHTIGWSSFSGSVLFVDDTKLELMFGQSHCSGTKTVDMFENKTPFPTVRYLGLKAGKKEYYLPKPVTVECRESYGENIDLPIMSKYQVLGDEVRVELPDNTIAEIKLEAPDEIKILLK